jgi:hypothetical protein
MAIQILNDLATLFEQRTKINENFAELESTKYAKPGTGIPLTDLAAAVQTSLGKADTALQSLPIASNSVLGGVKVGSGLTVAGDGTLSATGTVSLKTIGGQSLTGTGDLSMADIGALAPSVIRTPTATTTGLQLLGTLSKSTLTPPTNPNADVIIIGDWTQFDYAGTTSLTGGVGHLVGTLAWMRHIGTGTITLAIANESKLENTSTGMITTAVAHEAQVSTNAGTLTTLNGVQSRVTGNAGTIGTFNGLRVGVEGNTGTVGQVNGLLFPDLSGVSGITRKFMAYGLDANAPIFNASIIVDGSSYVATPSATGFTVTIPDRKAFAWISPAADYASGTVVLPTKANLLDGQRLRITFNKAVDSVAWTLSGVTAGLFLPGAAVAGMVVELTYNLATDFWICTSGASVGGRTILLGSNVTISNTNAAFFDGAIVECSSALTITINANARRDLGFAIIPPATGSVTVASDGTVLLNGATTALTRNAASNPTWFALAQRASNRNAYLVSGS